MAVCLFLCVFVAATVATEAVDLLESLNLECTRVAF